MYGFLLNIRLRDEGSCCILFCVTFEYRLQLTKYLNMLNECHIGAQHYVQIPHNASLPKKKGILPNFPSPCGVNLYTKSFHQTLRTVGSLRLGHLLTSLPCCCTRSGRNPVDRLHRAFLDPGYPGKATSWSIVCRTSDRVVMSSILLLVLIGVLSFLAWLLGRRRR